MGALPHKMTGCFWGQKAPLTHGCLPPRRTAEHRPPPCAGAAPPLQGERHLCLPPTSTRVSRGQPSPACKHRFLPKSLPPTQPGFAWGARGSPSRCHSPSGPGKQSAPGYCPCASHIFRSEQIQVLQEPDGFASPLGYKLLPARWQGKAALSLVNNACRLKNASPARAGRGGGPLGWLRGGTEGPGEHRSGKSSRETDIPLSTSAVYLLSLFQALALAFSNPQLNE